MAEKCIRSSLVSKVDLDPKNLAASIYYGDGLTQSQDLLRQRYYQSKDPNNRVHIPYYHKVAKRQTHVRLAAQ